MGTFLGTEGERIMYDNELTEPVARDIIPFSRFPSDNELLLPPGFSRSSLPTTLAEVAPSAAKQRRLSNDQFFSGNQLLWLCYRRR